jgi:hypothetical protein
LVGLIIDASSSWEKKTVFLFLLRRFCLDRRLLALRGLFWIIELGLVSQFGIGWSFDHRFFVHSIGFFIILLVVRRSPIGWQSLIVVAIATCLPQKVGNHLLIHPLIIA